MSLRRVFPRVFACAALVVPSLVGRAWADEPDDADFEIAASHGSVPADGGSTRLGDEGDGSVDGGSATPSVDAPPPVPTPSPAREGAAPSAASPSPGATSPAATSPSRVAPADAGTDDAREPPSEPESATDPVVAAREPSLLNGIGRPLGVSISGYVQAQFEAASTSEDQLQQDGSPLNEDRFLVRRARLRVDRVWKYADAAIEIDGNTTRTPTVGFRRAEVSLFVPSARAGDPPIVRVTGGLSEIPFGRELVISPRYRAFMERSAASLAFFPGEPDLGVRVSGGYAFLRYAVALQNGVPVDDRPGHVVREFNAAKDLVARVGVDTKITSAVGFVGGVSWLTGTGFHPGTSAQKGGLVWRDLNENNAVDIGETTAIPATAATPSENFSRWAFGADAQVEFASKFGKGRVYGEITVGQNLDRGYFVADPIATGFDARELGWYLALVHDVTRYGLVGFRVDYYDPNADFFDRRRGKLVPTSSSLTTLSPLVGIVLPGNVRLVVQGDFIRDSLARDDRGVPTDLKNDRLTVRLQGEL